MRFCNMFMGKESKSHDQTVNVVGLDSRSPNTLDLRRTGSTRSMIVGVLYSTFINPIFLLIRRCK